MNELEKIICGLYLGYYSNTIFIKHLWYVLENVGDGNPGNGKFRWKNSFYFNPHHSPQIILFPNGKQLPHGFAQQDNEYIYNHYLKNLIDVKTNIKKENINSFLEFAKIIEGINFFVKNFYCHYLSIDKSIPIQFIMPFRSTFENTCFSIEQIIMRRSNEKREIISAERNYFFEVKGKMTSNGFQHFCGNHSLHHNFVKENDITAFMEFYNKFEC